MGIDVSHAMFDEDVPIPWTQETGAATFDSIAKVGGQLAKEGIELVTKLFRRHAVRWELEQEWPGMWLELRLTKWPQNHILKELSVEKASVRLTCPGPIARVIDISGDGQLIPHLEAHVKIVGNLVQVASEMVGGGWTAIPRVVADGAKERPTLILILAILSETFSLKAALGEVRRIDLALPTLVGPGGGTEANER